jgi:hypothetical protein
MENAFVSSKQTCGNFLAPDEKNETLDEARRKWDPSQKIGKKGKTQRNRSECWQEERVVEDEREDLTLEEERSSNLCTIVAVTYISMVSGQQSVRSCGARVRNIPEANLHDSYAQVCST